MKDLLNTTIAEPVALANAKATALRRRMYEKHIQPFVFVHINKTGGSSIQRALGIPHDHLTALEKRARLGLRAWDRKFKFCIVRNPWDKVVSHFHYRVQTNQTGLKDESVDFGDWVGLTYRDRQAPYYDSPKFFMPQTEWISREDGKIIVDFVGRFEHLDEDFKKICEKLGRKGLSLPHDKKSNRGRYASYYTPETRDIVAEWFKADIDNFGYKFESE